MKVYVSSIGTANPDCLIPQQQIADFMANALNMNELESRKLKALYRASGIKQRHTVIKDFGVTRDKYVFFPQSEDLEPFPSSADRMNLYAKEALPLCVNAIKDCFQKIPHIKPDMITHLVTISCTGMYAPGLDIELVEQLGLNSNIERTSVNFMGCYAAFNGLKLAYNFCHTNPKAKVLVVCVELCTIHFQKGKDPDNILSNSLFADGAAAFLLQTNLVKGYNLLIKNFHCDLATSGKNDMAWTIGDKGFEMKLSSYVPDVIKKGIKRLATNLMEQVGLTLEEVNFLAIHPGGRKILEVIEEELGFSREDNRYAYEVLKNYGNMSSATVMFVLHELLKDLKPEDNSKNILSFAFGPGLTMESMVLEVAYADD